MDGRWLNVAGRYNVRTISLSGGEYPPLLRNAVSPPTFIYAIGAPLGDRCYIAIAGTREPSPYGAELAYDLGRELALRGFSVVTGGARGVDARAWEGARSAGGHVAVVAPFLFERRGSGPWRLITRGEALVAEHLYRPGGYSIGQLLVARDRIVAGMSAAVVIPEAKCPAAGGKCAERGWGTRHTAEFGLSAGRLVVVVEPAASGLEYELAFRHLLNMGAVPARSLGKALQLVEGETRRRC